MRRVFCHRCLLGLATALSAGCGSSESLTDPDPNPNNPNNPHPPPATLPLRTDLGTLGGESSYAYDINDGGVVVGEAQTSSGVFQAFRWTSTGGLVGLAPLAGDPGSRAVAVANDNTVLGVSVSDDGSTRPVVWDPAGAVTELPISPIAGTVLAPNDRNAQGTVVGDASFIEDPTALVHAWMWSAAGGLTDLAQELEVPSENYAASVNDGGAVAGTLGGGLWRAYLRPPQGGVQDLGVPGTAPERTQVTAQAVKNDGRVVGWTQLFEGDDGDPAEPVAPFPAPGTYAYLWTGASGFTLLDAFEGEFGSDAIGNDVNDRGDAVGSATPPGSEAIKAVAWPRGGAITDLNAVDANPSTALAVNSAGIAVGWTSIDGGVSINRATVWNLDQLTPLTARVAGRAAQPAPARRAEAPLNGAARCLQLRPVSKSKLAECIEGRAP
jgi:probable HAF family extracellular repeat protein